MNFNCDTDVNESVFEDIRRYQTIDTPDVVYQLLGDMIILDRYKDLDMYDQLYNRVVDIATCCWNIPINHDVMQHTSIRFKIHVDDTQTYALPLNRFMMSMTFIRTILPYLDYIDINDFILHKFMSEKDREAIQNNIVKVSDEGNSNVFWISHSKPLYLFFECLCIDTIYVMWRNSRCVLIRMRVQKFCECERLTSYMFSIQVKSIQ